MRRLAANLFIRANWYLFVGTLAFFFWSFVDACEINLYGRRFDTRIRLEDGILALQHIHGEEKLVSMAASMSEFAEDDVDFWLMKGPGVGCQVPEIVEAGPLQYWQVEAFSPPSRLPVITFTRAAFPLWVFLLLLSPLPVASLIRRYLRRRSTCDQCRKCGYDLRASTGQCPECGTVIPVVLMEENSREVGNKPARI